MIDQEITCPKCGTRFTIHAQANPLNVTETRDAGVSFGEVRTFAATEIRVVKGDDGKTHVTGHAAVFNSLSRPLKTKSGKTFMEKISPGAFKRSLESNPDIVMLDDHDPKKILARTSTKTLKLSEDERGLRFDATLPDTTTARDLVQNIEHGNVRGVSFGFNEPEDRWEMEGDTPVRTLLDVPLGEVSATPFPAYEATDIAVRSIDLALQQLELGEKEVRGQMIHLSHVRSMAENCRSMCRSAYDTVHSTHEAIRTNPNPFDEHEKRALKNLHEEAGNLRSKLGELRAYLRSVDADGDYDGDEQDEGNEHDEADKEVPDKPLPEHDREPERSAKISQQYKASMSCGLPVVHLRSLATAPPAVDEARGGESVHGATASRARAAIKAGKTDNGEWSAPNQGDRDQKDCLGSDLSYPIFKGDKVSIPALRAAASRGAQHAPAVGKEASALLELANGKKDDDGK